MGCLRCAKHQTQGFVQYWASTLQIGLYPRLTSFLCFCVPSFARVILAFGLIFLLTVFRRAGVCGFAFHPLCPENEVRNGGVPGVSPTFAVLDPDQLHLSKKI